MIRAWHTELLLAAALLGLASIATPPVATGATSRAVLRDAIRPFALPALWRRADVASRNANPEELLAAGRLIADLLPEWTDGAIHYAWTCAFEVPRDRPDRDPLAALMLAVDWLREDARRRLDRDAPEDASELLLAAATIVDHAATIDPTLAARIRREFDTDPSTISRDLVARAASIAPDETTQRRLASATFRMIAGAVRMHDLPRAQATVEIARRMLEPFAGRADADLALAALDRLKPLATYLHDPAALQELTDDPMLADVADALRTLTK